MIHNLIDELLGNNTLNRSVDKGEWVYRDLPSFYDQYAIYEIMYSMIKELGGTEYCMEFLIYRKNKTRFSLPKDYLGIPIKCAEFACKRKIILRPFLL